MLFRVTATLKGYVAAVVYVNADNWQAAIESAEMSMIERHDAIRAEPASSF